MSMDEDIHVRVKKLEEALQTTTNYLESAADIILDDVFGGDDIDGDDADARELIEENRKLLRSSK